MNPLIRKEIRLLLPAWVVALLAATMPVWPWQDWASAWPLVLVAAVLGLALSPFGQEMSYGTFGLLLVQPEDRRRFWRIKTGLLAVALVSAWTLFAFCKWASAANRPEYAEVLRTSAVLTLLAFSGGLWSTLLIRDMVGSFFCTCLVPLLICGATLAALGHWVDPHGKTFITILYCELAAYLAAGFLWARRLFLGAQDVPWTGGQISLTAVRGMSLRWLAFEFKSRQNRWTALVKKELQLQEVTMVLIPLLVILHAVTLAIYHLAPHWTDRALVLGAVPWIWLMAVPFVIGCVAVAEERRLNTLENLLCLPTSKRSSFAVKLAVALVLGIVLGGFLPWLMARMAGVRDKDFELHDIVMVAASITGLAFYASTMSRGLLHALPTALCIPVVMGMLFAFSAKYVLFHVVDYRFMFSSWFPALAVPAMIITLVWLAFNNYKRLQIGWRVWLGDLTRVSAVLGCVTMAAIAIFGRSWELFLPLEPRHGPARIRGAGRATLGVSNPNVCALLPDGRLWVGEKIWLRPKDHQVLKSNSGGFADGSNWVKLAANYMGAVAIQSEGTLWRITNSAAISPIGSDSDWNEVAAGGSIFLAVKRDGTLWGWGHDHDGIISEKSELGTHGLDIADPVRVGKDSDWERVFVLKDDQALGVKRDGSTWAWGKAHQFRGQPTVTPEGSQPVRANLNGSNWLFIGAGWELTLLIRDDGSLWAAGNLPSKIFGENVRPDFYPERVPVRVGAKSDWISVSGNWEFTALEANGTLCTMSFEYGGEFSSSQSKHPSKYTDWLAATEYLDQTWGLARDGTLSCWNEFGINEPDRTEPFMKKFFLGPIRRPVLSLNILGQQ